jgi:thiol-disulfide isomerase/thioredoxin
MKKFLFSILLSSLALNMFSQSTTGFVQVEKLENSKEYSWFKDGYNSYEPDKLVIDSMQALPPTYSLIVFGGTWCDDTRALLPKLYKFSDQVNISRADISLYMLDEKKQSPEGLEKKYNIINVPTFIVLKDGAETGRIVESVKVSLEKDLYSLMH